MARTLCLALSAALLMTSCGGGAQTKTISQTKGKTLRLAIQSIGTSEKYLPWLMSGHESSIIQGSVYDALVDGVPGSDTLQPGLATKWTHSSDYRTWTFDLRSGIKFQDGTPFSASDVLFTYQQYIGPTSDASSKAFLRGNVSSVQVVSPTQVVFHLKHPVISLPAYLTDDGAHFYIASKAYVTRVGPAKAAAQPIGTGPYKLLNHVVRQSVTLQKYAGYWGHAAGFAKVVITRVPDSSTRLSMLQSGQVDVAPIPYLLLPQAKAAGLRFVGGKGTALYDVVLQGGMPSNLPTFDPKVPWVGAPNAAGQQRALLVRKAMALAINKQAIIKSIFQGQGQLLVSPWIEPGSPMQAPGAASYPFNPSQARSLLRQAGYPNGFSLAMWLVSFPGRSEMVDVAKAVAADWHQNLGLKITSEINMTFSQLGPKLHKRAVAGTAWVYAADPYPTTVPTASLVPWALTTSPYYAIAHSKKLDSLLNPWIHAPTPKAYVADGQRAMEYIYKNYLVIPIAAVNASFATNPKVVASWPMVVGEAYPNSLNYAQPAS